MISNAPKTGLPVEDVLPDLMIALSEQTAAVLQAPPGAGKTTTVPLWLMDLPRLGGRKIILLEPRRLAARAAAKRMADLLGEEVGQTVGYRIRFDTKVSAQTRIEVVTEGILTRKLQTDPELSDVGIVIFDEFHERSLNSDLGLALTRQAQEFLRDDLCILVMSATLDAEGVAKLLDDAPVITSDGKLHPVQTRFIDRTPKNRFEPILGRWIMDICSEEPEGDILVFLPGAGEINRLQSYLSGQKSEQKLSLHTLYGNLPQSEQDRALNPHPDGVRKIVLATDIAETSLTIEGVRIVVDAGLARKPRFDPNSGMSRLELRRISKASADQRRGRAGRLGPGICYRMWSAAEDKGMAPHSDPEIAVADLSSLALELAKWGVTDANELSWMTPPPEGLLAQARDLLKSLGAIDDDFLITDFGSKIVNLPLHPRLAAMIIKCSDSENLGLACDLAALLSERDILRRDRDAPNSDIKSRLQLLGQARASQGKFPHLGIVLKNAADLRRRFKVGKSDNYDIAQAGPVLSLAYPDRIGEKRQKNPKAYRLSGGRGAVLADNDKLVGEPYIVVADLDGKGRDARIQLAAPISYQQLMHQFQQDLQHRTTVYWDEEKDRIIADDETCIGALVLDRKRLKKPDAEQVANTLLDVIARKDMRPLPWDAAADAVLDRAAFVAAHAPNPDGEIITKTGEVLSPQNYQNLNRSWLLENMAQWLLPHLTGKNALSQLTSLNLEQILLSSLSWQEQQYLDDFAPAKLQMPTGSHIRLDYRDPDSPVLAVRLQELFGQADLPKLANGKVPIAIHLLSPARRPAQITTDLAGFWENSYDAVKKDLKGQYPKHYWPDDPMQAEPTARAKPRKK